MIVHIHCSDATWLASLACRDGKSKHMVALDIKRMANMAIFNNESEIIRLQHDQGI